MSSLLARARADAEIAKIHLAVAFDVRRYYIEKALLQSGSLNGEKEHVKTVRLIAQYLLMEKASIPQVLEKAAAWKTSQRAARISSCRGLMITWQIDGIRAIWCLRLQTKS